MEYGNPEDTMMSGCSSPPASATPSPLMYQPRSLRGTRGAGSGGSDTGSDDGCQPRISKSVFGTSNSMRTVRAARLLKTSSGKSVGVATSPRSAAGAAGGPQCVVVNTNAAPSAAAWLAGGRPGQTMRRKSMSKASGGADDQLRVAQIRRAPLRTDS